MHKALRFTLSASSTEEKGVWKSQSCDTGDPACIFTLRLLVCFGVCGGTGDGTRGLHTELQSHCLSYFVFYFEQGLTKWPSCVGWAWTCDISASASQLAGITGGHHTHLKVAGVEMKHILDFSWNRKQKSMWETGRVWVAHPGFQVGSTTHSCLTTVARSLMFSKAGHHRMQNGR